MENDILNKLWKTQNYDVSNQNSRDIISKARQQRTGQYISITVMLITVLILVAYAIYHAFDNWNTFNTGLSLMISSLTFRIILEQYTLYRKESQLISMDLRSFQRYLKKYYKIRMIINYIITPLSIAVYITGFYLLLPYFKGYFSQGFYTYIIVSGIISLLGIMIIILNSIIKEQRFLNQFKKK